MVELDMLDQRNLRDNVRSRVEGTGITARGLTGSATAVAVFQLSDVSLRGEVVHGQAHRGTNHTL